MDNKNKNLTVQVNGEMIDTSKYDYLLNKQTKKTIVDQTNPLLERAKKLVKQMEEEKKYPHSSLISFSVNITKY